ncbi:helix-turn-helix domain-containing protein [Gordonia sp. NB41Y]|uniref:sigma-54-dependent Fis family transcriptional regulator n=1 Tax=Gordonia sp. NB41Y TaxID=875808 RepID=UPI001364DAEE|nr:helix-turn-helix domain-containing protein [Gordonia sp. NB41Y]WLP89105.1 helix-turn-helix domain-containing protein [Gordonia sp. NB41Y]
MTRREDEIREAREHLITQGLIHASVPTSLVPQEIEQSWRRSVSHRVNPAADPHVLGEIDPDSVILRAAGRILDQWQTNLADSRMTLLLADDTGRILSRRTVDPQDVRLLDRAYAVEGFDFSEQSLGTNGLGTPLEARSTVFVRGSEHFNDALARLACAGAPIKHPITGRVVGSLSIASHVTTASPLMVAMVRQAGDEIAEALELMADSRDLELARTYRALRSSRHPVLVMNAETVMTDVPALSHLDAESHAELWESLRRHRWEDDEAHMDLPSLGATATVHRLGRPGPDSIFALEFREPVTSGEDAVTAPGHRRGTGLTGDSTARLGGRRSPAPYAGVQVQLTAAAATPGLLTVVGAAGTGKRYQSRRWLRQHTGKEPVIVEAADLSDDATAWAGLESAARDGGIIVHGAEGISDALREHLAETALRLQGDDDRRPQVVLTERSALGALHDVPAGPGTVRVPSLTELRGELTELIREIGAELHPGAPPHRFSPAALQVVLAWHWPGNVAELVRLLSGLPDPEQGVLIQTRDLPHAMRQTNRSSLSRYEQAERDTIMSALDEAEGNKSRAADILGIGRTTLYRKMRALKIDDRERMITPE